MRKFNFWLFYTTLLLNLIVTSCTANNPITYEKSIEVTIFDEGYSPYSWTVPSGEIITLIIKNDGNSDHNWSLIGWPISTPFTQEDRGKILFQVSIGSGEIQRVSFTAPNGPGEYKVVSIVDDQMEARFIGKLIVIHADEVPSRFSE